MIWGPTSKGDSDLIENVQRRATRLIPELKDLPYEDRLRHLNLPSMKFRRQRGDLIQTYKILNGIDRLDPETNLPNHRMRPPGAIVRNSTCNTVELRSIEYSTVSG